MSDAPRDPTLDDNARRDAADHRTDRRSADPLRGSRTSRAWVALVALVVVLLLLVIFIAQNTQQVEVSFLGWTGHPPLSVALLVAAAAGLVVAATAGTLRILQLHRRVRRTSRG
jgi:uncharacterized integral membrane protein